MDQRRIIIALLRYAYEAEVEEQDVLYYALQEIPVGDDWEALVKIMKDNEIHKIMIEDLVKILGGESLKVERNKYEFANLSRERLLELIAKTEKFAYYYYKFIKKLVKDLDIQEEDKKKIEATLNSLIEWEKKHIEIVDKLLKSFGVRFKII
jgi:hypothetical protein